MMPPPLPSADLGSLRVIVMRAEGLVGSDRGGSRDPVVEVSMAKQVGRVTKECTPIQKKTLNPVWSTGNTFQLPVRSEQAVLCCAVFDYDVVSANEFLGEALLTLDLIKSRQLPGEHIVHLTPRGSETVTGSLVVQVQYDPHTNVEWASKRSTGVARGPSPVSGIKPRGSLRVTVHKATNLLQMDSGVGGGVGSSDPFVRLVMCQNSSDRQMHETSVIACSLNPIWTAGNVFEFQIEEENPVLFAHVIDADPDEDTDDYIGQAMVEAGEYLDSEDAGQRAFKLTKCTDHGSANIGIRPVEIAVHEQTGSGIRGELFLSFAYVPPGGQPKHPLGWAEVLVHRASNLVGADSSGLSDPFVQVIADQFGPVETCNTTCIPQTLNPVWSDPESGFVKLEIRSSTAQLVIRCCDKGSLLGKSLKKNTFLGEALLDLTQLIQSPGPASGEQTLPLGPQQFTSNHSKHPPADPSTPVQGTVTFSVSFVPWVPPPPPLGELAVKVVMAEGLASADIGSQNDTYVELVLDQAKGSHTVQYRRYRTPTIYNSNAPVWDSMSEFMLRVRDKEAKLFAHCFDEDWGSADDYLGEASVSVSKFMSSPNTPVLVKLPLGERTEGLPDDNGSSNKCCGRGGSPENRGVLTLSGEFFPNTVGLETGNVSLGDIKSSPDDDWEHVGTASKKKLLCGCAVWWLAAAALAVVVLAIGVAVTVTNVIGCMDERAVNFDTEASISRESSCVYATCDTSVDCNAPRGACVAGTCQCELGFTGQNCLEIQQLFAPRVDGSLALSGGSNPAHIQRTIASLQDGVSPDDVTIDSFSQNVTGVLNVPGLSYGMWADESAQDELRDAVGASIGVSPNEVTFTDVEAAPTGRRLQQDARTAITVLISSSQDISSIIANETGFTQRLKEEAARVCAVCGDLVTEELSAEMVDVVTAVVYHVAPKFSDPEQAAAFGEILLRALSDPDMLESAVAADGSGLLIISSIVADDFSIAEAFSRVADAILQQFVDVFERIRPTLLTESRTIQFGSWAVEVTMDAAGSSPIIARVSGAIAMGDLMSDVRDLPKGLAGVMDPMRTMLLRNVTVIVSTEPVVAVEFSAILDVQGNPTPWQMTAFRTEDDEWDYFTTVRFNALWDALALSLGDSLGQHLERLQVPELGTVLLASEAETREQSGIESIVNAFTFKIGVLTQIAPTNLQSALLIGDDQQLVQQLMLQDIEAKLREGLVGTIEYKGRLLALSLASTNEEGIRFGATMTGPPITLGEALGDAEAKFNEYFATSTDAMATITQSALSPLLQLEFSHFSLAAKTNPPTLDVASDITWRGVNASFELSMSKNLSLPWEYSLMVAWRDLDPLVTRLSDYISMPTISGDAAIMISSTTTPNVRVGTWNGYGFDEVVISMPELDMEVLVEAGLDNGALQSQLAEAGSQLLAGRRHLQDVSPLISVDQLYERAHALAGGPIPNALDFAARRMEEGCSGTFQFRGRELDVYVKSSAEGGLVFGGASRGDAINLGEALGSVMQQIHTSTEASDLKETIQSNLELLSNIEISGLVVTGRTQPPSLHTSGSVTLNGVETDFEFSVTDAETGWEFGFVNQWADSSDIAAVIGLNVSQYVGDISLGPLAVMISSTTDPMVQVGEMEAGRRHLQEANTIASNLAKQALEGQLDLPLVVESFVRERMRAGVDGSLMLAEHSMSYRVASTTAGWHVIGHAEYTDGTAPALSDAMGPAGFSTAGSSIPAQYAAKVEDFLTSGPQIKSAKLEFWTSPPHVTLAGAVLVGEASELRFSFMANQAEDGWHFDLAAQTDFLEELWESLPAETLDYAGIDPAWSPTQVADLTAFAIHIEKLPDDANFELGTLNPESSEIEEIDLMSIARELPEFDAVLEIEDVPISEITVTVVIHASNDNLYLSMAKPTTAEDTLMAMVDSAEDQIDLAAQTAVAPPQLATFASALNSALLESLEVHTWTDWDNGMVVQLAGDVRVLTEPVAFSLLFAANDAAQGEGATVEWELTVAFDVWNFVEDHLSHIDFLDFDRRRFLQDDITTRGVIRMNDIAGVKELKIGRATLDGVRGPVPQQHWPTVGEPLQASDRLLPLDFTMGAQGVEVYVRAFSGEHTGTGMVAQVILSGMVLADVVHETLGPAMSDLCPVTFSGNSSSMFCQLLDMLLTISVETLTLEASMSDQSDAPLAVSMDARGLSFLHTPPLDLMLYAEIDSDSQLFGFSAHWDVMDFGGMLRGVDALTVMGTHICNMTVFEPFCSIRVQDVRLAYISHEHMCESMLNVSFLAACAPGLYFVSSMEFPPSFAIGEFNTETLQGIAENLLGQRLPNLNIPLALPATPSMKSLRMKLPMATILSMAGGTGRRLQNVEIPEFELGTNGVGDPLMTMRDFEFMMDASASGFAPGFEATLHLDMTGVADANGRRLLELVGHVPHRTPFWPQQRRLQDSLSGPEPAIVDVTIALLAGAKVPPCGPFAELDVLIEPALTWINPFGIADLSLTLQGLSGGVCFGTGIPTPSRLGLAGGFSWGNYMSGMIFIELEMSATASQFFYAEFRCSIEPCTLEAVLTTMGTEGLDAVRSFIPAMGVECNNPSCKVSLNTNGLLPGSDRTIRDLSSPIYREIVVPGGLMVDIPAFHFLGQSGYAAINIGDSEGFLHAQLRGPLRLPPPLNWLTIGLEMPDFENQLDMTYSPAGVSLAIASRIIWGEAEIGATLSLVADPAPTFQLGLSIDIPASDVCRFDFAVDASAAMVLDSGSEIGVGGEFELSTTEFNLDAVECMAYEMQDQVKGFWSTMLEEWVEDAGNFLDGARGAVHNALYTNNMGFCRCEKIWRPCNPGECESSDDNPCAGRCHCDESVMPDTCRCACPDNIDDCIDPGGSDGADKRAACRVRCATQEGRDAALVGQLPPGAGRRRMQQENGVPGQYLNVNGNRTFVPELRLPSIDDLIDADCIQWTAPAKGLTDLKQTATCLRYAHRCSRLNALLVRFRMLMTDPLVKLLLKDGGRGLDLGDGRRGSDVLAERAGREHKFPYTTPLRGGLATRQRKGFGSWAGVQLLSLTEAAAEAIGGIGEFFRALDGDYDVIGEAW